MFTAPLSASSAPRPPQMRLRHHQRGGGLHRGPVERPTCRKYQHNRVYMPDQRLIGSERTMSAPVANAIAPSAAIITRRRSHRSTSAPATGPRIIWGSMAIKVAVASTVADPVVLVSHQTSANCTNWLPNNENTCPVQMVKTGKPNGILVVV